MLRRLWDGSGDGLRSVWIVTLALCLFASPAWCDDPVPSNLNLMTGLTRDIADELYTKFAGDLEDRGIKLKPFGSDERYQFLTNVFTSALADKGLDIYQSGASEPNVYTIEYQALTFDLQYPRVYRSWLFGGKKFQRRADVTILATVYDPSTGSVVWVGQSARDKVDEFEHSDVNRVEEGTFAFARPPHPSSGWGKLVEPVFVGGIVVGLIYLFFQNQNSDGS